MKRDDELLALRAPPHNLEAEQAVIGGVLLSNEAYENVAWLASSAFYSDRHRRIWEAIVRLLEAGKQADMLTLTDALGPEIDIAGGPRYLSELMDSTPSAMNIARYAKIVQDKAELRALYQAGMNIAEQALRHVGEANELVEAAESTILGIREARSGTTESVPIGKAVTEYLDWIDEHPSGIETGLSDLDSLTGGLLPGNLVVIAGRTHMGKTSLALQMAEHICSSEPGVMFSLEASRREIAGRLVEWHKNRIGRDAAVQKIFKLKFFIDETPAISPGQMRARLRRLKKRHGLSVVVVDYLQLVRGRGDNREQEVASVSRELKAIAKEFAVPVIALSQLSRKVEERADKRPHMSDLRESGSIEQDADLIEMVYRPDYYDAKYEGSVAEAEIIVAKNRNTGRTGQVKVMFSRDLGRFSDYLPERLRGAA